MPGEYSISSGSSYSSSDNDRELGEDSDEEVLLIDHSQCSSSDEDVVEEEKNCDDNNFGPWEEYGEETYFEDLDPPFRRKYKCRGLLSGLNEPIDFFNLFISDELLEDVCEKSDKYYKKYKNNTRLAKRTHKKKWNKPDLVEIRGFLGLLLSMGILKKPKLDDYWTTNSLFQTPGFGEIMSRDHFKSILRCFIFYDIENIDHYDRLYKIRSFIDHIVLTSRTLYEPEQHLTIDER